MLDFLVFDNFYPNPDEIRTQALSLDYYNKKESKTYKKNDAPWPGRVSKNQFTVKGIDKIFGNLLQLDVRLVGSESNFFRYITKNDEIDAKLKACHVDCIPEINQLYSAVIYLNKDTECIDQNGNALKGTKFFRHKQTGQTKINSNKDYMMYLADFADPNKWMTDVTVYLKYNRCVLFNASLFHNYGDFFGDSIENARLTHIYSLQQIK